MVFRSIFLFWHASAFSVFVLFLKVSSAVFVLQLSGCLNRPNASGKVAANWMPGAYTRCMDFLCCAGGPCRGLALFCSPVTDRPSRFTQPNMRFLNFWILNTAAFLTEQHLGYFVCHVTRSDSLAPAKVEYHEPAWQVGSAAQNPLVHAVIRVKQAACLKLSLCESSWRTALAMGDWEGSEVSSEGNTNT